MVFDEETSFSMRLLQMMKGEGGKARIYQAEIEMAFWVGWCASGFEGLVGGFSAVTFMTWSRGIIKN